MKKVCPTCGKEFETPYNSQKYCSPACWKSTVKKICVYCGKEFETPYNKQKYCSNACKSKARLQHTQQQKYLYARSERNDDKYFKGLGKRQCLYCGKEFAPIRRTEKFCCSWCEAAYFTGDENFTLIEKT